jgi:hypothetical protein
VQRDFKGVMAELLATLTERLGPRPAQENATEVTPRGAPVPIATGLRWEWIGRPMEQLLHLGAGGGDAGGGAIANDAGACCGILPSIVDSA